MKQRTVIVIVFFLSIFGCINAQSNVGIGTATPDASAKVEVSSSSQGFLMPRMTESQRNAIISPANGLMVYQTNNADGTYYYDGTQWRNLSDNLGNHTATTTLNMDTNKIVNVPTPVAGLDAVNKDYVDAAVSSSGGGGGGIGGACCVPGQVSDESDTTMNLGDAIRYCDTLSEGGNNDWYLPTFGELLGAFSHGSVNISDNTSGNYIWTRSQNQNGNSGAYYMAWQAQYGAFSLTSYSTLRWTRCVRNP